MLLDSLFGWKERRCYIKCLNFYVFFEFQSRDCIKWCWWFVLDVFVCLQYERAWHHWLQEVEVSAWSDAVSARSRERLTQDRSHPSNNHRTLVYIWWAFSIKSMWPVLFSFPQFSWGILLAFSVLFLFFSFSLHSFIHLLQNFNLIFSWTRLKQEEYIYLIVRLQSEMFHGEESGNWALINLFLLIYSRNLYLLFPSFHVNDLKSSGYIKHHAS